MHFASVKKHLDEKKKNAISCPRGITLNRIARRNEKLGSLSLPLSSELFQTASHEKLPSFGSLLL